MTRDEYQEYMRQVDQWSDEGRQLQRCLLAGVLRKRAEKEIPGGLYPVGCGASAGY